LTTPSPRRPQPGRNPAIATALSWLWPGLGQWYAGRARSAAVYALPMAIVVMIVLFQALASGIDAFAASIIDPSVALTLLILIALFAVWRLLAMVDAVVITGGRKAFRGRAGAIFTALAALVLAVHGVAGYYAWSFYDAGSRIFVGEPNPDGNSGASPGSSDTPAPTDDYVATPFATPATENARITVLFTGIDHTASRTQSLTDTLLVVSVDPSTHSVAMVSFPRDIAQFQMYNGATYNGKINSLMSYAKAHPTQFPDGPLPTLVRELSFLLGTPIHYYAAIDIDGFRRIIDAVGGVDVNVQRAIQDARYDWLDGSPLGFFLSAGKHHMDGRLALAYVRSRYGVGDNDFTRAARQQQLLVALRQKLTNPAMLTKLPDILKVAGDTIRTNFPADRVDEMVALARGVDEAAIQRFVLQPPTYSIHPPTNSTGGTYILRLHMDALANLSLQLFGQDSSYWYPGVSMPPGAP
jgi:LCP family protein required for cell wall assembly